MKKIWECFETEAFNELINYSFNEVRNVFNHWAYYVSYADSKELFNETSQAKKWYLDELAKLEKYAQTDYTELVNSGIEVPEYDEPSYLVKAVEIQTKKKLIGLIKKYYNKEVFQTHKYELYGLDTFKEEPVETPHELLVALNLHKDRIYSLLSILGYYQRCRGYFISQTDFYKICYDYSHQVYCINKSLGMKYRFVNIFISSSRIKPSKGNRSAYDVDEENWEQYQSNKFIDIDKISLLMLIQPYLKHNTQEIKSIIEIMSKNLNKRFGRGLSWEKTLDEVNTFIAECETRGIMKRL